MKPFLANRVITEWLTLHVTVDLAHVQIFIPNLLGDIWLNVSDKFSKFKEI